MQPTNPIRSSSLPSPPEKAPVPAATGERAERVTPQMAEWLRVGWDAQCVRCNHRWHAHTKVGDTRCPRYGCGDLPTKRSAFAAIDSYPSPAGDAYAERTKRTQQYQALQQQARTSRRNGSGGGGGGGGGSNQL